jgi:hypothetical protein
MGREGAHAFHFFILIFFLCLSAQQLPQRAFEQPDAALFGHPEHAGCARAGGDVDVGCLAWLMSG